MNVLNNCQDPNSKIQINHCTNTMTLTADTSDWKASKEPAFSWCWRLSYGTCQRNSRLYVMYIHAEYTPCPWVTLLQERPLCENKIGRSLQIGTKQWNLISPGAMSENQEDPGPGCLLGPMDPALMCKHHLTLKQDCLQEYLLPAHAIQCLDLPCPDCRFAVGHSHCCCISRRTWLCEWRRSALGMLCSPLSPTYSMTLLENLDIVNTCIHTAQKHTWSKNWLLFQFKK